jgi:hypothetical protein
MLTPQKVSIRVWRPLTPSRPSSHSTSSTLPVEILCKTNCGNAPCYRELSVETLLERAIRPFRERRMRSFAQRFAITPETTILDVGGTALNWSLLPVRPRIVFLNTGREQRDPGFVWVIGDGCSLPFRDGAFEVAFSNSVIEHVGDAARQHAFADEIARVGRRYWVQTPNRSFPVEPHLLTPFLHWLPARAQRWLALRFTVWAALVRPSADRREFYIRHYLNDIRLLTAGDLRRLFPGARLVRERLLGLTKSLIATR